MKRVVFSFDDGRIDTYTNAYPILKKYKMPFTLNVCTDFVEHPEKYSCFGSADNKSVSVDNLLEMQQNGVEIACHGHLHLNTKEDVLDNISALARMGLDVNNIGFASPNSEIREENADEVLGLVNDGYIAYIRSGIQVRREGLLFSVLSLAERKLHSPLLFYNLNKRCIIRDAKQKILLSVGIHKAVTLKQLLGFVEKMKDGEAVIFMFHSILNKTDVGYGRDNWYFDSEQFEQLCKSLSENDDVIVCSTRDLIFKGK